jgi:hypothetical protein
MLVNAATASAHRAAERAGIVDRGNNKKKSVTKEKTFVFVVQDKF